MSDLYLPPRTLKEALERLTVPWLKDAAERLTARPPARKAELVSLICAAMSGDGLRRLWNSLSQVEQRVLGEAVYNGGELDWTLIAAKYGLGPGDLRQRRSGLFAPDGRGIPRDLRTALESLAERPPAAQVRTTRAVPEGAFLFAGEQAAPLELEAVLRLVEAGRLRVGGKTGLPSAATANRVTEVLVGGDFFPSSWTPGDGSKPIGPIRAFAWPLLLQEGGLAHSLAGKLVLSKKGAEAVQRPTSQVIKGLWEAWLDADFDEFSRVEGIKGRASRGGRHMTLPEDRRQSIAFALEELPKGEWVEIEAFEQYLLASGNEFKVSRDPWRLYILEPQYGSLGYGGIPVRELVERRYLMAFLFEYAATLGLIDLAYTYPNRVDQSRLDELWGTMDLAYLSRYDGLLQFRLNDLGAYALGLSKRYVPTTPRPSSHLRYAGDGVLEGEDLLPADRLFLERFARKSDEGRWTVARDSLATAAEAGVDVASVRKFLTSCLGTLPEDLDFLLSDVEGGSDRLSVVGMGTIVEVSSAELARRLAGDRTLQEMVLLAAPRHLVILPSKETPVRKRLRQLGLVLPRAKE